MVVRFTPEQEAFARQAIKSGRLRGEDEVVAEALSLWELRERRRAEILAAVDEAEASLAGGAGGGVTGESIRDLKASVREQGRARLAADQKSSR